jgi:hypothetical protein
VLRDESLQAVIDTFDSGDLMVAKTGFGSLEKKRFRWFNKDGGLLGTVLSRDPIRRVLSLLKIPSGPDYDRPRESYRIHALK